MKEIYVRPKMELIELGSVDVVTASCSDELPELP